MKHQDTSPYRFSDQVGHLLRRAYQRHQALFQAKSHDLQLTAVQFSTLCALVDNGPQSQSELVIATGVDQATIRGIIDRLTTRGFVALTKDRRDARRVIIAITPNGIAIVKEMIPRAQEITELTFGSLNPAERFALIYTLRAISGLDEDGKESKA